MGVAERRGDVAVRFFHDRGLGRTPVARTRPAPRLASRMTGSSSISTPTRSAASSATIGIGRRTPPRPARRHSAPAPSPGSAGDRAPSPRCGSAGNRSAECRRRRQRSTPPRRPAAPAPRSSRSTRCGHGHSRSARRACAACAESPHRRRNRPRPVTSGPSSRRGTERPTKLMSRSSIRSRGSECQRRSAARMRCGVAGNSSIETPKGDSASLIALTTAAGAPIAPPSPSPLALVMEASVKVSR